MSIDREAGMRAGEAWAIAIADQDELEGLENFVLDLQGDIGGWLGEEAAPAGPDTHIWWNEETESPMTHAEHIAAAAGWSQHANACRRQIRNVAEVMFGQGYNDKSAEWLEGFVTMAMNTVFGWRGGV